MLQPSTSIPPHCSQESSPALCHKRDPAGDPTAFAAAMANFDFLDARFDIRGSIGSVAPDALDLGTVEALKLPPVDRPASFLRDAFANTAEKDRIRFAHGTTTLAFMFQGGIIVAVDSRASMGQCMLRR